MMYIDLLSFTGKYRGISGASRGLGGTKVSTKRGREYFDIYEKYMDWLSKMDNTFDDSVLQMLIKLRDERIKRGAPCEIIFYSDNPEEFHLEEDFLGFDVYWVEEGISGIEDSKYVHERYVAKLNDYGLFNTYEDAQEFCDAWKKDIDLNDPNSWALSTAPLVLCVWAYRD